MHKIFYIFPLEKMRNGVRKNRTYKGCILSLLMFCITALSCHKETKAERYAREARETTLQCPMAIDANTTLDSMAYTPSEHRFTYYYMVSGMADSLLKANEEIFRQQIHERLLNAPDMIPYIQDELSFRYIYRTSTTGAPVLDFVYNHAEKNTRTKQSR